MKKPKRYEIKTFEQLYNIATPENVMRLLIDFGSYLMMYVDMTVKLRKDMPESKSKLNTELFDSHFIWVDDGIVGVSIVQLTNKETGEVREIKMKKNENSK